MIKIAICDDEKEHRDGAAALAGEYAERRQDKGIVISSFFSPVQLLNAVSAYGPFDIYILDVVMPEMSGIDLGLELRRHDTKGKIIYLTTTSEYGVHSYLARAFYYLLKPVEKEALFSVLESAMDEILAQAQKSMMIKTGEGTQKVDFDNVLYVELSHRAVIWHLSDDTVLKSVTVRIPFAEAIDQLLADERFFMCGASLACNLSHVTSVEKDAVVFKTGKKLYTPKSCCTAIRSRWLDFWLKNGVGGNS